MHSLTRHILMIGFALLPFVVMPAWLLSQAGAKVVWVTLVVLFGVVASAMHLKRREVVLIPQTGLFITVVLLPIAYGLSMFFAEDISKAVLGYSFQTDSFLLVVLGATAFFLTVGAITRKKHMRYALRVFMWSVLALSVVAALQALAFAGILPELLTLTGVPVVASWIDIALLLALGVLILMAPGDQGQVIHKVIASVALIVLLVFFNVINIWLVLGVIALVRLVQLMLSKPVHRSALVIPVMVLIFSSGATLDTFVLKGAGMSVVQQVTHVSYVDVRPSWAGTLTVGKEALLSDNMRTLFGPGIGSFDTQWRLHRPVEVNSSEFWKTSFSSGVGLIPTSVITGGVVVLLAWIFLLLTVFVCVLRYRTGLLFATVFMWVSMIINPIGVAPFILAFVITGLAVGELAVTERIRRVQYKITSNTTSKTIRIVAGVVFVGAVIGVSGVIVQRVATHVLLQRAAQAMTHTELEVAEQYLSVVERIADTAMVERIYTRLALYEFTQILNTAQTEETKPAPEELQSMLSNVLGHARGAIERDPNSPENYIALGSLSEQLIALGVDGAEESALTAYAQARERDPKNPEIQLAMARVSFATGDTESAMQHLDTALTLKQNYVPALYLSGVLYLSEDETEKAITALFGAIQINQNYADALYYLSVALERAGRYEEALTVMTRVQQLNPDNADVAEIINVLTNKITSKEVSE